MEYERLEGGGLESRRRIGDSDVLIFRAQNIRQSQTGLHATITVGLNSVPLEVHAFNIENGKERQWFVNKVYGGMNGISAAYGKDVFANDLMIFCVGDRNTAGLWKAHVGTEVGGWLEGETDPQTPGWLLEPYVVSGGGTIMFGPPKSAKSYTALLWALSMQHGVDRYWPAAEAVTLYINLERSEQSLRNRVGLCNRVLGLDPRTPLLALNRKGRRLADVYDAAAEMVKREGVGVAILDSLSRSGVGDLVKNETANDAMDMMNALAETWIAIAHTPRETGDHVFGSQMFDAAADVLVRVQSELDRESKRRGIGLRSDGNDIPPSALRTWTYEFAGYGLSTIREAERHEWRTITEHEGPRSPDELVLDQLLAHGSQNQKTLATDLRIAPSTLNGVITRLLQGRKIVEVEGEGRGRFYGAADTTHNEDSW